MSDVTTIVAKIGIDTKQFDTSLKGMQQEFKALKGALGNSILSDEDSKRVLARMADLKASIADASQELDLLDTGNTPKMFQHLSTVGVGAMASLTASMSLFGAENEKVMELQKKMITITGILGSLQMVAEAGKLAAIVKTRYALYQLWVQEKLGLATKKQDVVVTTAQTVTTKGYTTATGLATVATRALGVAMKALPFVAIAAILSVVIGYMFDWFTATKDQSGANKELKETQDALKKSITDTNIEYQVLIGNMTDKQAEVIKQINKTSDAFKEQLKSIEGLDDVLNSTTLGKFKKDALIKLVEEGDLVKAQKALKDLELYLLKFGKGYKDFSLMNLFGTLELGGNEMRNLLLKQQKKDDKSKDTSKDTSTDKMSSSIKDLTSNIKELIGIQSTLASSLPVGEYIKNITAIETEYEGFIKKMHEQADKALNIGKAHAERLRGIEDIQLKHDAVRKKMIDIYNEVNNNSNTLSSTKIAELKKEYDRLAEIRETMFKKHETIQKDHKEISKKTTEEIKKEVADLPKYYRERFKTIQETNKDALISYVELNGELLRNTKTYLDATTEFKKAFVDNKKLLDLSRNYVSLQEEYKSLSIAEDNLDILKKRVDLEKELYGFHKNYIKNLEFFSKLSQSEYNQYKDISDLYSYNDALNRGMIKDGAKSGVFVSKEYIKFLKDINNQINENTMNQMRYKYLIIETENEALENEKKVYQNRQENIKFQIKREGYDLKNFEAKIRELGKNIGAENLTDYKAYEGDDKFTDIFNKLDYITKKQILSLRIYTQEQKDAINDIITSTDPITEEKLKGLRKVFPEQLGDATGYSEEYFANLKRILGLKKEQVSNEEKIVSIQQTQNNNIQEQEILQTEALNNVAQKTKQTQDDINALKRASLAMMVDGTNYMVQTLLDYEFRATQENLDKIWHLKNEEFDKERDAINRQVKNKIIGEEEAFKKQTELEEKRRVAELEHRRAKARADKREALFNIAINTGAAVIKALPNMALVASTLFISGLQASLVASKPLPEFALGGFIEGKNHKQGGVPLIAEGGEYIINKQATAKNKDLLNSINNNENLSGLLIDISNKLDNPNRAYVVETELTSTQKSVKRIEQRAKF